MCLDFPIGMFIANKKKWTEKPLSNWMECRILSMGLVAVGGAPKINDDITKDDSDDSTTKNMS